MKKALCLVIAVLMLSTLVVYAEGAQEDKITIQIEGSAVPYYAPIFVAIENGFFAEEGLDVDYMFGNAADIAKNVSVGNVEFGFPNGEPVLLAKSQGLPVKVIHSTLQHGLGATIFLDESGIKTPADLKGKSVAITSLGSPNYVQLQVLLKTNGMTLEDINLEIIGSEAIVPALVNGRVDAICFSMLRTFELKYQGINVSEFRSDDFMPSFGNVVIVGAKYLESNQDEVIAFGNAMSKSMEYLSDPANMATAIPVVIEKYTPTYEGREEYITAILSDVYADYLWVSEYTDANGFGYSSVEKWKNTADKMFDYNLVEDEIEVSDMIWNNTK